MSIPEDCEYRTGWELNPDKIFYVIHRKKGAGMFSDVMHVMNSVDTALRNGMIPVVDLRLGRCLYNENKRINGSENPWEYYFEQPCGFSLDEVYSSKNIVVASGNVLPYNEFYHSDKALPIYERYLTVKKNILQQADDFFSAFLMDKTILGVHFRGGDMIGAPQHPIPPNPEQMIEAVNGFLDTYPVDAIFLVTEVLEYSYLFKKMYPEKIILANEFRGTNAINPYRIAYPRDNHRYHLGREVIINTLLLSKADYFIAGGRSRIADGSNVSRTAQILNHNKYKAQQYIDNDFYP